MVYVYRTALPQRRKDRTCYEVRIVPTTTLPPPVSSRPPKVGFLTGGRGGGGWGTRHRDLSTNLSSTVGKEHMDDRTDRRGLVWEILPLYVSIKEFDVIESFFVISYSLLFPTVT